MEDYSLTPVREQAGESVSSYVYRTLHRNIMILTLPPGAQLSEPQLARTLGVSRTPVREAIHRLKEETLLYSLPQRYTAVSPISVSLVREGYLLRSLVEPTVFLSLAGTLDRETVFSFQENLTLQKEALSSEDVYTFNKLDDAFHKIIYLAARKSHIWSLHPKITGHYNRVRYLVAWEQQVDKEAIVACHEEIYLRLLTGLTDGTNALYQEHFSAYQHAIPQLQEQYPDYFQLGGTPQ